MDEGGERLDETFEEDENDDTQTWYFDLPEGAWERHEQKHRELRDRLLRDRNEGQGDSDDPAGGEGSWGRRFLFGRKKDKGGQAAETSRFQQRDSDDTPVAPSERGAVSPGEGDEWSTEPHSLELPDEEPPAAGPREMPLLRQRHSPPPPPPDDETAGSLWDAMLSGSDDGDIIEGMRKWARGSESETETPRNAAEVTGGAGSDHESALTEEAADHEDVPDDRTADEESHALVRGILQRQLQEQEALADAGDSAPEKDDDSSKWAAAFGDVDTSRTEAGDVPGGVGEEPATKWEAAFGAANVSGASDPDEAVRRAELLARFAEPEDPTEDDADTDDDSAPIQGRLFDDQGAGEAGTKGTEEESESDDEVASLLAATAASDWVARDDGEATGDGAADVEGGYAKSIAAEAGDSSRPEPETALNDDRADNLEASAPGEPSTAADGEDEIGWALPNELEEGSGEGAGDGVPYGATAHVSSRDQEADDDTGAHPVGLADFLADQGAFDEPLDAPVEPVRPGRLQGEPAETPPKRKIELAEDDAEQFGTSWVLSDDDAESEGEEVTAFDLYGRDDGAPTSATDETGDGDGVTGTGEPEPAPGEEEEKKPGLLARLFGRGKKQEEPDEDTETIGSAREKDELDSLVAATGATGWLDPHGEAGWGSDTPGDASNRRTVAEAPGEGTPWLPVEWDKGPASEHGGDDPGEPPVASAISGAPGGWQGVEDRGPNPVIGAEAGQEDASEPVIGRILAEEQDDEAPPAFNIAAEADTTGDSSGRDDEPGETAAMLEAGDQEARARSESTLDTEDVDEALAAAHGDSEADEPDEVVALPAWRGSDTPDDGTDDDDPFGLMTGDDADIPAAFGVRDPAEWVPPALVDDAELLEEMLGQEDEDSLGDVLRAMGGTQGTESAEPGASLPPMPTGASSEEEAPSPWAELALADDVVALGTGEEASDKSPALSGGTGEDELDAWAPEIDDDIEGAPVTASHATNDGDDDDAPEWDPEPLNDEAPAEVPGMRNEDSMAAGGDDGDEPPPGWAPEGFDDDDGLPDAELLAAFGRFRGQHDDDSRELSDEELDHALFFAEGYEDEAATNTGPLPGLQTGASGQTDDTPTSADEELLATFGWDTTEDSTLLAGLYDDGEPLRDAEDDSNPLTPAEAEAPDVNQPAAGAAEQEGDDDPWAGFQFDQDEDASTESGQGTAGGLLSRFAAEAAAEEAATEAAREASASGSGEPAAGADAGDQSDEPDLWAAIANEASDAGTGTDAEFHHPSVYGVADGSATRRSFVGRTQEDEAYPGPDKHFLPADAGEDENDDLILRAFEAHAATEIEEPSARQGPEPPPNEFDDLLGEGSDALVADTEEPEPVSFARSQRNLFPGQAAEEDERPDDWMPVSLSAAAEAGGAGDSTIYPDIDKPLPANDESDKRRTRTLVRELVETGMLALLVFLAVRASFQNFKVDGNSMAPTLTDGQFLIVNKLIYSEVDMERMGNFVPFVNAGDDPTRHVFHPPQRGDIIVLNDPSNPDVDLIKRVVGLPNEKVEIHDGAVYIDDYRLEEPYIEQSWNDSRSAVLVPDGHYYVLGDNRDNSKDSRSSSIGFVPEELVIGRAELSYWPLGAFGLAPNGDPTISEEDGRPSVSNERIDRRD